MARITRKLEVQQRIGLGEATESVVLEEGYKVEIARDSSDFVWVKDEQGRRFSVPRDAVGEA